MLWREGNRNQLRQRLHLLWVARLLGIHFKANSIQFFSIIWYIILCIIHLELLVGGVGLLVRKHFMWGYKRWANRVFCKLGNTVPSAITLPFNFLVPKSLVWRMFCKFGNVHKYFYILDCATPRLLMKTICHLENVYKLICEIVQLSITNQYSITVFKLFTFSILLSAWSSKLFLKFYKFNCYHFYRYR